MTELNMPVPNGRNKLMSFYAFEKERFLTIWRFLIGKKEDKQEKEISIIALVRKVYQEMPKESKRFYFKALLFEIMVGIVDGLDPTAKMLVYGALPAVLTGGFEAIMLFIAFFLGAMLLEMASKLFFEMRVFYFKKYRAMYSNQRTMKKYAEIIQKPRAFFIVNMPETVGGLANSLVNSEIELLTWVVSMCSEICILVICMGNLFFVSPLLMVSILLLSFIDLEWQSYQTFYFRHSLNKNRLFKSRVGKINNDMLRNTPIIQEALTFAKECKKVKQRMDKVFNNDIKVFYVQRRNYNIMRIVVQLSLTAIIGYWAIADIIATGDIGRFALITGAAFKVRWSAYRIGNWYQEYMVQERNRIVDTEKQLVTPKSLERICGGAAFDGAAHKIELRDVEFSYPKTQDVTMLNSADDKVLRGEQVLKGVNLEIYSGGITVVAGMSGQGKSTLMNLIRHDYDVTAGKILLNGVNVQKLSDEAINKQMVFIDQNVHFFDNTLLYNLKYFNENASDADIYNALETVGLSEEVARFKDGLFHKIGQDGKALSGGQRQRLALARIFLTNRPIMILDEPTTGLDQVLSFKVMKSLKNLAKNKTVLLVTHNPTEIALADRVLVVHEGQIAADGTVLELVEKSKFLASCLTRQDVLSKQALFAKFG